VVCSDEVAAPVGNGNEAADVATVAAMDTGSVPDMLTGAEMVTGSEGVFGEMATTAAQSAATGAVEGGFTAWMLLALFGSLITAMRHAPTAYENAYSPTTTDVARQ
jgi:hypothetical protein